MQERLHQLDSLRFIAAAVIVVAHCAGFSVIPGAGITVDCLFILSGFVLGYSFKRSPKTSYSKFAINRTARCLPLYFFSFLLVPGISITDPDFLPNLLLLQNIIALDIRTYNFPSWSISAEFWMNIVLLYWIMRYRLFKTALVLIIICYAILWPRELLEHGHVQTVFFTKAGLLRCTAAVLMGYLTYQVYDRTRSLVLEKVSGIGFSLIEVGLVAIMAFFLVYRTDLSIKIALLFLPLFIYGFAFGRGFISSFLSIKQLSNLGNFTYGIYIFHIPVVLQLFDRGIIAYDPANFTVVHGIIILLISMVIAIPAYYYVELPARKYLMAKLAFIYNRPQQTDAEKPRVSA